MPDIVTVDSNKLAEVRHDIVNIQTYIHAHKIEPILRAIDKIESMVREELVITN